MCENARQAITDIKDLGRPVKRGFGVVIDEISKIHHEMDSIKATQAEIVHRQATQEAQNTEILKLVNSINDKITTSKMEEKAAQMDMVQHFFGSKFGKIVLVLGVVVILAAGVGLVYVVDHSHQVAEIASSVK